MRFRLGASTNGGIPDESGGEFEIHSGQIEMTSGEFRVGERANGTGVQSAGTALWRYRRLERREQQEKSG